MPAVTELEQAMDVDARDASRADARVEILVVEPDPLLRELVAAGLALWNRRFVIETASDLETALARSETASFDIVISEIVFAGAARRDALQRLRTRTPHAAWIVLTDSPAELFRRSFDYDAVVAKPPEIGELGERIERLLDRGQRSVVRGISLPSFLQVISADAKSGTLEVRSRITVGTIGLDAGRVVDARTEAGEGRDALFEMLAWREPVLTLFPARPERRTIDEPLPNLLLEFTVLDDARRAAR